MIRERRSERESRGRNALRVAIRICKALIFELVATISNSGVLRLALSAKVLADAQTAPKAGGQGLPAVRARASGEG